jgi:uncharacterized membrane protein YfcA
MICLGLAAGVMGGMFGIGGGLIMVPALILIFGFELKTAFGTSLLAQLLPVALLGVAEYWRRGQVEIASGLWLALGLFAGAWFGGMLTGLVPREPMKQGYGVFLVAVGVYFLLAPSTPTRKPTASAPATQATPAEPAPRPQP